MTDPCLVAMRGIVPSLNTPFTADDRIDEAGVASLVDATVNAGVAGMLILAVAGEQGSLSAAEKEQVGRIIVARTQRRIPVVMSVTAPEVQVSRDLAAVARAIGADGVCCQAPAGLADDALEDAIARIADAGPDLFMLQDLDWSGGGLPLATILRLFERVKQFRSLKVETVPAGPKYTKVLAATGGRLHVAGGWAVSQMPEALTRGVHAFMPTALDHVYCRIYRLWHAGRPTRRARCSSACCRCSRSPRRTSTSASGPEASSLSPGILRPTAAANRCRRSTTSSRPRWRRWSRAPWRWTQKPRANRERTPDASFFMLRGIDPLLSADLLHALRAMGHGDEIAVVDANFPAASNARRLIRLDGVDAPRAVAAILSVLPLDSFVDDPLKVMAVVGDATKVPDVVREIGGAAQAATGRPQKLAAVARDAFYERARTAYAIVATGERRFYGKRHHHQGRARPGRQGRNPGDARA
jgi:L-fucose mutarotase/ribose pyranase (RbsD/FucU family)/dihydrodipicolinate synthase/N-acetylneuraminate lyase